MAGKPRFRVPTLEEMENADNQDESLRVKPSFKQGATSKSPESNLISSNQLSATAANPQGAPLKRMISQKALLSRQPISSRTKVSPKKTLPTSSPGNKSISGDLLNKNVENTGKTSTKAVDLVGKERVSRLTGSNVGHTSSTTSSSSAKTVTSHWTGKTLGSDSRNAVLVLPNRTDNYSATSSSVSAPYKDNVSAPNKDISSDTNKPSTSVPAPISTGPTTEEQDAAVRADVLPTLAKLGKTNSLVVNPKQRGNPILNFVRNVPWEFGNIVPDYVMGQSNCALFLSLRYHQLHPEYVHHRLKLLGRSYDLRVLLVQVDIKDPHHLLKELAKICILADCTLMLAFNAEEAGRYLETYKVYENKPAEAIMEQTDGTFSTQLTDCLTRVKSVNKTDCSTLMAAFGNVQGIMNASVEDLSLCPGFGPQKAKRLYDVFREPFLVSKKQRTDPKK